MTLASAVRSSSSAAWTGFSETTRVLTCYGPDSVRQAELSYLTESGHADRKPGGVSLNLVCDLGMARLFGSAVLAPG